MFLWCWRICSLWCHKDTLSWGHMNSRLWDAPTWANSTRQHDWLCKVASEEVNWLPLAMVGMNPIATCFFTLLLTPFLPKSNVSLSGGSGREYCLCISSLGFPPNLLTMLSWDLLTFWKPAFVILLSVDNGKLYFNLCLYPTLLPEWKRGIIHKKGQPSGENGKCTR